MIIDIHNHPDFAGKGLKDFIAEMDEYNIDITWLQSCIQPEDEYEPGFIATMPTPLCAPGEGPMPFHRCLHYKEAYPDRFILGYAPDPRRSDCISKLKAAMSLYNIKLYGELKLRMMYDNWDALRVYRFCGENNLPVLVHIDYEIDKQYAFPRPNWWYGGGIDAFERCLKACPDTTFIGHAPGFWAHISGDGKHTESYYPEGGVVPGGAVQRLLDTYDNLYCDLCGNSGLNALKRDPEYAVRFLTQYQDRLMYGRDMFGNDHQEFIDSLGLSPEIRDKLYCRNALKLIPLD